MVENRRCQFAGAVNGSSERIAYSGTAGSVLLGQHVRLYVFMSCKVLAQRNSECLMGYGIWFV